MSLSLQNLAGKTKGKAGNIVFYQAFGQDLVKGRPRYIKNTRTPAQQLNRQSIEPLILAYRTLKPLLMTSLNFRPENRSVYAQFFSINLNNSFVNGLFYPDKFKVSGESNEAELFTVSKISENGNNLQITWNQNLSLEHLANDILCFASYNETSQSFNYKLSNVPRSAEIFKTYINLQSDLSKTYLYIFFVKYDYSNSSQASIIEIINN